MKEIKVGRGMEEDRREEAVSDRGPKESMQDPGRKNSGCRPPVRNLLFC